MNTTEIINVIESTRYSYYALRVADNENLNIGDDLRPSRQWYDGNVVTDEDGEPMLLNGTSGLWLVLHEDDDSCEATMWHSLERITQIYHGDQLLVIGGDRMEYGEDDGEIVIRDATILFAETI